MKNSKLKQIISKIRILVFIPLILVVFSSKIVSLSLAEENEKYNAENIKEIIHDYLMNNPEIIIESLNNYREKELEKQAKERETNLSFYYNKLTNKDSPRIGSTTPKITLIEFIDYNCGYCKKTMEAVLKLSKNEKELEIIFKEFPILSETSDIAAAAALAAHNQSKYIEYHTALLSYRGKINNDLLLNLAENVGLDLKQFENDMKSKTIIEVISETKEIAEKLGIRGTPTFIIGNKILPGAYDFEALKNMIENERNRK